MFKPSRQPSAANPQAKGKAKPKAKPKARMGADGLAEPVVAYMNHAPVHPIFIYAKGLFRPLQNGTRAQGVQATSHYTRGAHTIECRWSGEAALDITDQLVFFYLCQQAAIVKKAIPIDAAHHQPLCASEPRAVVRGGGDGASGFGGQCDASAVP